MIESEILGTELKFHTDKKVFSPDAPDKGTLAMLNAAAGELPGQEKILDLGCGYGVVGIFAAKLIGAEKVVMSDSDRHAVDLAEKNAVLNNVSEGIRIIHSNAFRSIDEKDFTMILSNPPYHADFSVPKEFIEKGFNRLKIGGKLFMVTKRLPWYKNKLTAIFGGVRVTEAAGYYVFCAEKRREGYANK